MQYDLTAAENLSNLAWLVFACAGAVLWRRLVLLGPGSGIRRSFFALICLLIFMFPVISISDDLHPDLIIAAEGDGKSRRLLQVAEPACSHSSTAVGGPAPASAEILSLEQYGPVLLTLLRISPADSAVTLQIVVRTFLGRSPPSLLASSL